MFDYIDDVLKKIKADQESEDTPEKVTFQIPEGSICEDWKITENTNLLDLIDSFEPQENVYVKSSTVESLLRRLEYLLCDDAYSIYHKHQEQVRRFRARQNELIEALYNMLESRNELKHKVDESKKYVQALADLYLESRQQ